MFQCQTNLQESQLRRQKQLQDLELKIDNNKELRHQTQLNDIKVDITKLKTQNQALNTLSSKHHYKRINSAKPK